MGTPASERTTYPVGFASSTIGLSGKWRRRCGERRRLDRTPLGAGHVAGEARTGPSPTRSATASRRDTPPFRFAKVLDLTPVWHSSVLPGRRRTRPRFTATSTRASRGHVSTTVPNTAGVLRRHPCRALGRGNVSRRRRLPCVCYATPSSARARAARAASKSARARRLPELGTASG